MKIKYTILIGILILTVYLAGCQQGTITQSQDKLNVIVSILPQKAFIKAVGGDHVNVNELIPPGGSPTTYEPKPSDLVNVEKADIYFRVGHIPFEKSHADKFAGLNPNMKIVDTSVNVELRYFGEHEEHTHEAVDPHIWLSPLQLKKQVEVIADALSEIDSDNSAEYMKNTENFKKELDDLHNELKLKFGELKTDKLMVFHPAWGYFADEYGLEQIAIEQDGKEPTAKQLQYLVDQAREENIKVIFVQSQFTEEIAESIADEIDAVVISINPLSDDYINNLRNVATTITEHLNK
ncbi:MAG: zinc ABC transporter substrate-binding protein [Nanoarchaeota archaeon]|nr:zinc ABC transporter substrate-binding protein [Nanoarchaeota archaeon]